jgi:4-aminobutyrate aminotransferase
LSKDAPALRVVRGKGLLFAIDLNAAVILGIGETLLLATLHKHGLSTTTKGSDAISFSPPLTILEGDLHLALTAIAETIASLR